MICSGAWDRGVEGPPVLLASMETEHGKFYEVIITLLISSLLISYSCVTLLITPPPYICTLLIFTLLKSSYTSILGER